MHTSVFARQLINFRLYRQTVVDSHSGASSIYQSNTRQWDWNARYDIIDSSLKSLFDKSDSAIRFDPFVSVCKMHTARAALLFVWQQIHFHSIWRYLSSI